MSFKDIKFPENFGYSSDSPSIPLEFYLNVLPQSRVVYLKLGYFSSKAIQVLSYSFAQFIYNGGVIKIVTNHFLYNDDSDLLDINESAVSKNKALLKDLEWIHSSLESYNQHFIDCLKYLVVNNRLEIVPVIMRPNKMLHYKEGVFVDDECNEIYMHGSCNFTAGGLVENAESISVCRSWGSDYEIAKLKNKVEDIQGIINKESSQYVYLDRSSITDMVIEKGEDKDIEELLREESGLLKDDFLVKKISILLDKHQEILKNEIQKLHNKPRFPFNSEPREYQKEAYTAWVEADKQGLFAMATGTGKTITSLNCLLNEYNETKKYQAIILVPSKALLNQWIEEVRLFNFRNVIPASSEYNWRPQLRALEASLLFDDNVDFVVITTYITFASKNFQKISKKLSSDVTLIADEAHNIGAAGIRKMLDNIKYEKRIGLSATPKRIFDEEGNAAIEEFFNSHEPYTYSFSMERAIEEGHLCKYEYYPHIIRLTEDEMTVYAEITARLVRYFNNDSLEKSAAVEMLLLERKRIIHKAENKLSAFKAILNEHQNKVGNLKYTFVYVPEGDDKDGVNIIHNYMDVFEDKFPSLRAYPYTHKFEQKELVLKNFEEGTTDVLFAMKCLDEGVDIPRAELAIFCSSTGNPRQFIQRRGRVLRKHPDKDIAVIHDLVVVPDVAIATDSTTMAMEKTMIKNEFARVINFASLANNYYEAMEVCQSVAYDYDLNIFAQQEKLGIINEMRKK
ncbi:MAG: DEAD/DEAH box helicase family protein [Candidatus Scalindua sp.]|jgi:superfamily II DNA or RNA helicase|nr:DEAD/DEAH box helicase family protein [Candidatus Scalindua sp.]